MDLQKLIEGFMKGTSTVEGFFTVILILTVWVFKEFRKSKLDFDDKNTKRIDTALELYGKALYAFKKNNNETNKELICEQLITLYPYAPANIIKLINDYIKNQSDEVYEKLYEEIEKEINYLKGLQYDDVAVKDLDMIVNIIEYYIKKNNYASFIKPMINTFLLIVTLLLIFVIVGISAELNVWNKILFIIQFLSGIFYCFLFIVTVDILFMKKYKVNLINVISSIVFAFSPLILFVPIYSYGLMLFTIIVIVYMFVLLKKIIIPNIT